MKNWARNDFALWREYRQFARHYLARELIDDLYTRVAADHALEPVYGDAIKADKKDPWHGETKSVSPTLAWTSRPADEGAVGWELEIYDAQRPVYRAQRITGTQFTLDVALEPCNTYHWSVRPAYANDGRTTYGEWMRKDTATEQGNGNVGRAVSEAHAYIQDFASLDVDCRAR